MLPFTPRRAPQHASIPKRLFAHKRITAAAVALLALAPAAMASSSPTTIALPNASLEQTTAGMPSCWQANGWGTNTPKYVHVGAAHSGSYAEQVTIANYRSGAQRLALGMGTSSCAPAVSSGHLYSLSSWYKTSGTARWVTWYLSRSTGSWVYWTDGPVLSRASSWTATRYTTPAVPADAARLSFGLSLQSSGSVTVDDFSMSDVTPPSGAQTSTLPRTGTPSPVPTTTLRTPTVPTPTPSSSSVPPPVASGSTTPPPVASGKTWYVSRNGDNSNGTSWASAWSELANIAWANVHPGDQVVIDGGATSCASNVDFSNYATNRPGLGCGMLYQTALSIPASGTAAVHIATAWCEFRRRLNTYYECRAKFRSDCPVFRNRRDCECGDAPFDAQSRSTSRESVPIAARSRELAPNGRRRVADQPVDGGQSPAVVAWVPMNEFGGTRSRPSGLFR